MFEALKSLALIYLGLGIAFLIAYLAAKYCFPEEE